MGYGKLPWNESARPTGACSSPPSAREIGAILRLSCAACLRRQLMRSTLDGGHQCCVCRNLHMLRLVYGATIKISGSGIARTNTLQIAMKSTAQNPKSYVRLYWIIWGTIILILITGRMITAIWFPVIAERLRSSMPLIYFIVIMPYVLILSVL